MSAGCWAAGMRPSGRYSTEPPAVVMSAKTGVRAGSADAPISVASRARYAPTVSAVPLVEPVETLTMIVLMGSPPCAACGLDRPALPRSWAGMCNIRSIGREGRAIFIFSEVRAGRELFVVREDGVERPREGDEPGVVDGRPAVEGIARRDVGDGGKAVRVVEVVSVNGRVPRVGVRPVVGRYAYYTGRTTGVEGNAGFFPGRFFAGVGVPDRGALYNSVRFRDGVEFYDGVPFRYGV
jgi:hypothetical protein